MNGGRGVPEASYGALLRDQPQGAIAEAAEQIRRLGYAVIGGGFAANEIEAIADAFEVARDRYVAAYGAETLKGLNEIHTLRAMVLHGGPTFLRLALNPNLHTLLNQLILGKFILNQQNGIINPPGETYNQGAWHRDLPYQHFVASRPLAINALYCVDDFTLENGSTFVLPASHKAEAFPSADYIARNAVQVEARAGDFIVLDCMMFHSGGFNRSAAERRGVNHVFTIPYIKQQISLPANMDGEALTAEEKAVLGFGETEPRSIADYLASRRK